jgi:nickel transport protein
MMKFVLAPKAASKCPIFALFTLLAFGIFGSAQMLMAHGVEWEFSQKQAYGLLFTFDDDIPMGFAEVKVYGPDDPEKLSQEGRTNVNGHFAFIPPADGHWVVTCDDGTGHLAKAEFDVTTEAPAPPEGALEAANSAAAPPSSVAPPAVNIEKEISKATKPYKVAVVLVAFIALALAFKAFKGKKPQGEGGPAETSSGEKPKE